jgi:hemerythrin
VNWKPETKIDNQHKQLVAAVNDLLDACGEGKGDVELGRTLEFLSGYTIKHFADEEKIQIENQYPDYPYHKRCHEEFKPVVRELAEELLREGPTGDLINRVYAAWATGWSTTSREMISDWPPTCARAISVDPGLSIPAFPIWAEGGVTPAVLPCRRIIR